MRFSLTMLLAAVVAAGCQSSKVGQPLDPKLAGNDLDAQLEFWHALPERKAVSNDEAFHALLLFVEGTDAAADYDGRVRLLKDRRMLPANFDGAAEDVVRRGIVAMALAKALEIEGGLTMQLFGSSPRYAVREMQYAGLFPASSPQQTFSGAEFLGIIGRAEDYQRAQIEDAFAPAADGGAPAPEAAAVPRGGV
jgi:hypothetical protein